MTSHAEMAQNAITVYILLMIIICEATSQCLNGTEFTCVNGNCISLDKVNNTVNDCMDNSDEVPAGKACRKGSFSCLNGFCRSPSWVLDGSDDCTDKSDEAKIVGQDCSMVKRDWDTGQVFACCDCDEYVPNSECVNNTFNITCQCKSGFYSNYLGTNCIRRVIGDSCVEDSDCFNAFYNSSCVDNACACDVGYYNSINGTNCVARTIGDSCSQDVECFTVVNHSNCTDDHCMCDSGFYRSDDFSLCVLREIGERCVSDHECYGVGNSTCIDGQCTCGRGYKNDLGPHICNMRKISEVCDDDPDCPVMGSSCINNTCSCRLGRYSSKNKKYCPLRVVGDACAGDEDCNHAFEHAYCALKSGVRLCDCDVGFYGPMESERCFSTDNNNDVVLLAVNVLLIAILIILIVWLVLYFNQIYKEKSQNVKKYRNKDKQFDYWVIPMTDGEFHSNFH